MHGIMVECLWNIGSLCLTHFFGDGYQLLYIFGDVLGGSSKRSPGIEGRLVRSGDVAAWVCEVAHGNDGHLAEADFSPLQPA